MTDKAPKAARETAFAAHDLRRSALRLAASLIAGAATGLTLVRVYPDLGWAVPAVAAWDVAAVTMLALQWWIIARADAKETQRRAAAEDPGRNTAWIVVLFASTFSLFAAVVLLRRAKQVAQSEEALLVVLCLVAVVSSWVLSHSAYTLRYAHLHYRDGEKKAASHGLDFPGDDPPDDLDFAYFAFTIGMCFQVSDVSIQGSAIRRVALGHSLLAFVYNTAVVALALNLVAGLVQ
jgi:uncharacterized membrane protein